MFNTLQGKLSAVTALGLVLMLGTLAGILTFRVREIAFDTIETELSDTLDASAALIDTDAVERLTEKLNEEAIIQAEDLSPADYEEDRLYWREAYGQAANVLAEDPDFITIQNQVRLIGELENQAKAYVYVSPGILENDYLALADWFLSETGPERDRAFDFGWYSQSTGPLAAGFESYFLHPENRPLYFNTEEEGQVVDFSYGYQDTFGEWISAYQPLLNEDGEHVGAIGIDFRAEYVRQVAQGVQSTMAVTFLIVIVVVLIVAFIIVNQIATPIARLSAAAVAVGRGDYKTEIPIPHVLGGKDELEHLAVEFKKMADQIAGREEKLKQEIQELRIEIDTQKRDEQVAQISESEFFTDLKDRATRMRERREQRGTPTPPTGDSEETE